MIDHPAKGIRVAAFLSLMLAVAFTVGASPLGWPQDDESVTFNMNAQHVGTGPGGQTQVSITITRWSTLDERQALEETFDQGGMQALAQALRDAPEVGFMRAPTLRSTSWRLRYAIMYRGADGNRIIRIATDRPVSFQEGMERRAYNWDFNVALIELDVDDEGVGEGVVFSGVEFSYDETHEALTIKNLSSQPVRLNDVRMATSR